MQPAFRVQFPIQPFREIADRRRRAAQFLIFGGQPSDLLAAAM
jgi:hypothetical protein